MVSVTHSFTGEALGGCASGNVDGYDCSHEAGRCCTATRSVAILEPVRSLAGSFVEVWVYRAQSKAHNIDEVILL